MELTEIMFKNTFKHLMAKAFSWARLTYVILSSHWASQLTCYNKHFASWRVYDRMGWRELVQKKAILGLTSRETSTSWWRNPASKTGLSTRCSFPKLLSNIAYLLARLLSEYSWVLALVSDWIRRFGNSSSASTTIFQNRHLFPRLWL